ncbi:MAG: DUF5615 family PIN-like protein [Pseudomonadota bacterium]
MRFLLEQNVPIILVPWIEQQGFVAHHTKGTVLERKSDREIVAWARKEVDVIVTKDADYRILLPISLHDPLQLVHLRVGNASNADFIAWFETRWPNILRSLEADDQVIEVI